MRDAHDDDADDADGEAPARSARAGSISRSSMYPPRLHALPAARFAAATLPATTLRTSLSTRPSSDGGQRAQSPRACARVTSPMMMRSWNATHSAEHDERRQRAPQRGERAVVAGERMQVADAAAAAHRRRARATCRTGRRRATRPMRTTRRAAGVMHSANNPRSPARRRAPGRRSPVPSVPDSVTGRTDASDQKLMFRSSCRRLYSIVTEPADGRRHVDVLSFRKYVALMRKLRPKP